MRSPDAARRNPGLLGWDRAPGPVRHGSPDSATLHPGYIHE
jgi:hypothetical protein